MKGCFYMARMTLLVIISVIICSCATPPPSNVDNICKIFKQYPSWYSDAHKVQQRWGIPISIQMAIIHQESKFDGKARPARQKLLWIIPWKRPSSSYGYAQALASTWENYRQHRGNIFSSRDDFGDAVDFIGWYTKKAHQRAGISMYDAYGMYLAYHEGVGGYMRKTYLKKPWLIRVARRVKSRSQMYQSQLSQCEGGLRRKSWFRIW